MTSTSSPPIAAGISHLGQPLVPASGKVGTAIGVADGVGVALGDAIGAVPSDTAGVGVGVGVGSGATAGAATGADRARGVAVGCGVARTIGRGSTSRRAGGVGVGCAVGTTTGTGVSETVGGNCIVMTGGGIVATGALPGLGVALLCGAACAIACTGACPPKSAAAASANPVVPIFIPRALSARSLTLANDHFSAGTTGSHTALAAAPPRIRVTVAF
ncbi:hypothetical protein [Sphingomonas lycopersici]|uniref:Uncharacterized protein n=1 Tax=Sphingomonas lycopersici TaxID=2951807 RepID=A0AA41Z715_9SPHN|nr:hypothetical protein [Sphingomonas lycopersici]MCW6535192.1 hypothetical protein [Sphingomonas lycopersici]